MSAFNISEFERLVSIAVDDYPHWRYGQTLFNVLHEGWPELANEIRGTEIDPFYTDDKDIIARFYEWLISKKESA